MKIRFVLFTAVATTFTLGGQAAPPRTILPAFRFEFPPVQIATPATAELAFSYQPWPPKRMAGPFRCGCMIGRGFGFRVPVFLNPDRPSRLLDPVAMIGAAYLKSRSVMAAQLDAGVQVDLYPEGRFGSWVQDGMLVTDRREITDEPEMQQVFALLVEAIGEREPDPFLYESEPAMALGEYRRITGFVPEVSFEFTGGEPLRIELNLKQERLLIQSGERWEFYALDRWSGIALRKLLAGAESL